MNGALRSRLDPSVLYLAVVTGDFGQGGSHVASWVLAVRAAPLPPRWLRASAAAPASLEIAPGATDTLLVKLNAEGLAVGDYAGRVLLRRDGPNGETVAEVPVALSVTEGTDAEGEAVSPEAASLAAYPNPASGRATVAVTLAEPQAVRVDALDVLGRTVSVLHDGWLGAGTHVFSFDAAGLPAGVYLVRLSGTGGAETRRFTLVR